jgi:hypothetical protein
VTAIFAALIAYLVVSGIRMHAAESTLGLTSCGPWTGPRCQAPLDVFEQRYLGPAMYVPRIVEFLPALIGAFIGAPLVARELETGTYRFAWTQGRNRVRWLVTKLSLISAALVAMGLAFSLVFSWWFGPWAGVIGRLAGGEAYEITGVVFAARILFGLCLGAAVGAVIRRTLPAMLATVVGWLAVAWPTVVYVRPLIETPISAPSDSNSIAANAWALHNWYQDRAGHHLSARGVDHLLALARTSGGQTTRAFQTFLAAHGWTQWSSFQPNNRFWTFQAIEALGYVALSAVLAGMAIWWVGRRAA